MAIISGSPTFHPTNNQLGVCAGTDSNAVWTNIFSCEKFIV